MTTDEKRRLAEAALAAPLAEAMSDMLLYGAGYVLIKADGSTAAIRPWDVAIDPSAPGEHEPKEDAS